MWRCHTLFLESGNKWLGSIINGVKKMYYQVLSKRTDVRKFLQNKKRVRGHWLCTSDERTERIEWSAPVYTQSISSRTSGHPTAATSSVPGQRADEGGGFMASYHTDLLRLRQQRHMVLAPSIRRDSGSKNVMAYLPTSSKSSVILLLTHNGPWEEVGFVLHHDV